MNEEDQPEAPAGGGGTGSCSTIEAAQQLGTSVQTVQRWMDRGYLRGWRTPGGHRRVDVASVREFLERARAQVNAQPVPRAASSTRVMVVDDSADDLELLTVVVRAVLPGVEVLQMDNAFHALASIGHAPPELLLTDIAMPGIDGLEMLRSLKDLPRLAALPVIAVTSHSPQELEARFGTPPGDLLYVRKPVTPSALRGAIEQVAPALLAARVRTA